MMDWAMISYDYMISPRAFQIGILIIFFSDSFWVWFGFFSLLLFSFLLLASRVTLDF